MKVDRVENLVAGVMGYLREGAREVAGEAIILVKGKGKGKNRCD